MKMTNCLRQVAQIYF